MKRLSHPGMFFILIVTLILLHSCSTTQFIAGNPKISMPLIEKDLIEEVHSVAVTPFFSDRSNWRQLAEETLSVTRVSLIPAGDTDLSTRGPDDRREILVKIGRSVHADAALNGVLISGENHSEIIIQLISTKDSRLLYWQAADFKQKEGPTDKNSQKELISKMLGPLLANIAKREKSLSPLPPPKPRAETQPKQEKKPEPQVLPKSEKKPKGEKRPDKGSKPSPPADEISPM